MAFLRNLSVHISGTIADLAPPIPPTKSNQMQCTPGSLLVTEPKLKNTGSYRATAPSGVSLLLSPCSRPPRFYAFPSLPNYRRKRNRRSVSELRDEKKPLRSKESSSIPTHFSISFQLSCCHLYSRALGFLHIFSFTSVACNLGAPKK